MLNTPSALQLHLRDTEEPTLYTEAKVLLDQKPRDCVLALVQSRTSPHEFAFFVFKRRRIIGNLRTIRAFPATLELSIRIKAPEFEVEWGEELDTRLQGILLDTSVLEEIIKIKEDVASYQRDAFSAKANTHKWLWHYAQFVPAEIRDPRTVCSLPHRSSCGLLPQHYGKQPMMVYIQNQLKKHERSFVTFRNIKGFAGTWNCGGTSPSASLVPWLRNTSSPDLVCIGLQEICKLTATNLLGNEERAEQWTTFVVSEVQAAYDCAYVLVDAKALVGLLLVVLVKTDLKHLITGKSVASSSVKLGCHGAIVRATQGNKGAVGTCFKFCDTNVCVVNCHLAPFKEYFDERNDHVYRILDKLRFPQNTGVYEHDLVLWLGDLNYRLDNLPPDRISTLIQGKDYLELSHFDQLNFARTEMQVLLEFEERPLDFQPSYKYQPGSSEYYFGCGYSLPREKKREPSWCDRILWRGELTASTYTSFMDLYQSDHKPVYLLFTAPIKQIDKAAYQAVMTDIYAEINARQLEKMPRVRLSAVTVDFCDVAYRQATRKKITVENEGFNKVAFRFRSKSECQCLSSWVAVSPANGEIQAKGVVAGRQVELEFTATLTDKHLRKARTDPKYLSCFFVLSVEGGSDYFVYCTQIEVKCASAPSCFGAALEDLCKVMIPVNSLHTSVQEAAKSSTVELPMPKELWRLIDFMATHSQTTEGLFMTAGDAQHEQIVRECLDSGAPFPSSTSPHSACSVLLEFLQALPDPVVPVDLLDAYCLEYIREGRHSADIASSFLKRLSPVQSSSLIGIMALLRLLPQRRSIDVALLTLTEALTHADADKKRRTLTDPRESQLQRLHRVCFLSLFVY